MRGSRWFRVRDLYRVTSVSSISSSEVRTSGSGCVEVCVFLSLGSPNNYVQLCHSCTAVLYSAIRKQLIECRS